LSCHACCVQVLAESCLDRSNLEQAGEAFVDVGCKLSGYGESMLFQPTPYPQVGETLVTAGEHFTSAGNALSGKNYDVCPL
jgi:hypothetical protein